jgi:hypothetical protein
VELAQTMIICQGRPRELLSGSTSLWESPHGNPWDGMFSIFPRWRITHHDSMHSFSIFFWFFLNSLGPPPRSRSNSRCHRCLPSGVGSMIWSWF